MRIKTAEKLKKRKCFQNIVQSAACSFLHLFLFFPKDDDGTSPDDDIDETLDDDYSNGGGDNSAPADEVADDSQTPLFGRHLVSKDKVEVPLSQDQTLTGLSASSLTVRDGVLQEGRTYAVGLKVSNQGSKSLTTDPVGYYLNSDCIKPWEVPRMLVILWYVGK